MNTTIHEMSGGDRPGKTMGAMARPAARNLARPAGGQLSVTPSPGPCGHLQPSRG